MFEIILNYTKDLESMRKQYTRFLKKYRTRARATKEI